MKRLSLLVVVFALILANTVQPAGKVHAEVDLDYVKWKCDGLFASGTTNAPYVILMIVNTENGHTDLTYTTPSISGGFGAGLYVPAYNEGTLLRYYVFGSSSPSPDDFDQEFFFAHTDSCAGTFTPRETSVPPVVDNPGRPIPASFVLHTITCTIAVFDAPGGSPVKNGSVIQSRQTWFVSPIPKLDAVGQAWTEIFVSGEQNGYIPTTCVD
ncbi:MAG TPA: hypothetical protein PLD47_11440 [Aggregatilineales bacterium]|nr:hypothetical protein [Anaerolineales bacterium]HRE48330.1 hypothetical protein [Aggregatilineales bacterium]